jgi:predicted ATPase
MTLNPHLTHLETSGLIQLAQEHPELEYLFRHALVQDAAYESLLLADRQRLHLLVGEALERLFAERLAEFAPMLGHHFMVAGQAEKPLLTSSKHKPSSPLLPITRRWTCATHFLVYQM